MGNFIVPTVEACERAPVVPLLAGILCSYCDLVASLFYPLIVPLDLPVAPLRLVLSSFALSTPLGPGGEREIRHRGDRRGLLLRLERFMADNVACA